MQETRPIDNQEPIPEEAVDINAGITSSGGEIVSDKKPLGSALSHEEMLSLEETRPIDNQEPITEEAVDAGEVVNIEEAVDINAGITSSGGEIVSDKKPLGNTLSFEEILALQRKYMEGQLQPTWGDFQRKRKEEHMKSLNGEVEELKRRIAAYQVRVDRQLEATDPTGEHMFAADTQRVADRLKALREIIKEFASAYFGVCNGDGSGKQLSESEKQSIIAALDGWCPQESWDSLLEHFSADKYICSQLPSTLAEALLHKHICDYLLTNPFWYFGCSNESKPTQTDDVHTPFWNTFGTQMYDLRQSFIKGIATLYTSPFQICTCRSIVERPNMTYLVYFSERS